MPSVSDWPFVPVPPPRGVNFNALKRGSLASLAMRTTSSLMAREEDRLRRDLVDRVVRGEHGAVGMPLRDVALEAAQAKLREEVERRAAPSGRRHEGQGSRTLSTAARRALNSLRCRLKRCAATRRCSCITCRASSASPARTAAARSRWCCRLCTLSCSVLMKCERITIGMSIRPASIAAQARRAARLQDGPVETGIDHLQALRKGAARLRAMARSICVVQFVQSIRQRDAASPGRQFGRMRFEQATQVEGLLDVELGPFARRARRDSGLPWRARRPPGA